MKRLLAIILATGMWCAGWCADDVIYNEVDTIAEYPGGIDEMFVQINKGLKISGTACYEPGDSFRVVAQFVVYKNGDIGDIQIIRGEGHYSVAESIVKTIKTFPRFKPAIKDGEHVNSYFYIPVTIKIAKLDGE